MNIVVPMGGTGTITNRGVTTPRYLVDIRGKPLFLRALEGISQKHVVHLLMRRAHYNQFKVFEQIKNSGLDARLILVDQNTYGSAHTSLLASKHIDSDDPVVIMMPDHIADFNIDILPDVADKNGARGLVVVAEDVGCGDPTFWVKLRGDGKSSTSASYLTIENGPDVYPVAGIYYWHFGFDFVKYARAVVDKDRKYNGKYHVPMVYNEAVMDGVEIQVYGIKKTWYIQKSSHAKRYEDLTI